MAIAGKNKWQVAVVAPKYFHGGSDLHPVCFEPLHEEPCDLISLDTYGSRFVHCFIYESKLRSILKQNWNLIHCWEEPYVLAGAQVSFFKDTNMPIVYHTAQNIRKTYPPPLCWTEQYTMHRASGWIGCGHSVIGTLKDSPSYSNKPKRMIPLGVDIETFQTNLSIRKETLRKLEWEDSQIPVIGYTGRFVAEKGVSFLMCVLDKIKSPWRALFVGNGILESQMRAWAKSYGDQVRIVTDARHFDMPAYLNAMDLLCAPSQTTKKWREQFGRMIIEAFACGVPVIGSDSGEIPYVIGDAGIIVSEKDEEEWVRQISQLLENPEKRKSLALAGRERAETKYAWSVIARQYLDFFEEILQNKE